VKAYVGVRLGNARSQPHHQGRNIVVLPAAIEPLPQLRAALQLVLEEAVRLAERLAEIRDAEVERRIRRHACQQIAAVARCWKRNRLQAMLQHRELRQQRKVASAIVAPGDLLRHGRVDSGLVGRHLVARRHQTVAASVIDLHGALQYRYARTLDAGIDRKIVPLTATRKSAVLT